MATMKTTTLSILLAFISLCSSLSSTNANIDLWCSKTPYAELCKTHMSSSPSSDSDFKKMTIQAALEHTHRAHGHTVSLASKCLDEKEKAAWADCVKLYEHTIHQLNKTLDPYSGYTGSDKHTWLSAALTNLETCRDGFLELNVTDNVLPLLDNDVSKLLSNSLAVNKAEETQEQTYKDGFPSWVSPGDRKLLQSIPTSAQANVVVAKDRSGNYRTIQAAINNVVKNNQGRTSRYVIYVKQGVYGENLEINGSSLNNIMLVGDGMRKTIITGSRSVAGGFTAYNSATLGVTSTGFMASGITFRNTAGSQNYQAVALCSGADKSVFYLCGIQGHQDTLYVHSQRQFYRECTIHGTVDFIFGNAAVVLQKCTIYANKPIIGQECTLTAQARTDPNQNTGISFHESNIVADKDLQAVLNQVKSYLGRPWKKYARVVYLKCYIGSLIDPAGWLQWNGSFALNTLYYGEYQNNGPGSSTSKRVKWSGYHAITKASDVQQFTVANFINSGSWLRGTGVPYTSSL